MEKEELREVKALAKKNDVPLAKIMEWNHYLQLHYQVYRKRKDERDAIERLSQAMPHLAQTFEKAASHSLDEFERCKVNYHKAARQIRSVAMGEEPWERVS